MQITVLGVLFFLLLVTVLVAAHELGHFWFARLFKMEVEEFAIGLGRPKWVWLKGERLAPGNLLGETATEVTEYTVRPIPFGGFVRIKGMEPREDGSEIHVANGFYSKPPWQRFLVLLAGPLFSVVAGIVLLAGLYSVVGVGHPSQEPVIGQLSTDMPGYKAGLRPGDKMIAIEGKPIRTFYDAVTAVRVRPEMPTAVTYERNGKQTTITITPVKLPGPLLGPDLEPTDVDAEQGKLGFGPVIKMEKVGLAGALKEAVVQPGMMVAKLASRLKAPSKLKDEVGGPITILRVAQQGVESGAGSMVFIAAMLSISLGIFNLLPLGMLDGGQMMVAFFEMLRRGKRLSFQVQSWIMGVGMAMVFLLIGTVLFIDIGRLGK